MDYPQAGISGIQDLGFLGGMFASKQQEDAQAMRALEAQKQGLANLRYEAETPDYLRRLGGEADQQQAAGYVAQGSKEQVLQQKITEALKGKSAADLDKALIENDSTIQQLLGAKAKYNQAAKFGQGRQAAEQIAQQFGFDLDNPQVRQQLEPILNDPEKVNEVIDQYLDAYKTAGMMTSKHRQEMDKVNAQGQYSLQHQLLANEGALARAEVGAEAKQFAPAKAETMSQTEARMRSRLASNPSDKEANDWLKEYERYRKSTQPGMGAVTIDPVTKQLTTVGSNTGTPTNKPALPPGWSVK